MLQFNSLLCFLFFAEEIGGGLQWLGSKFWGSRGRPGRAPRRAGKRQRARFGQREHPVESKKAVTVQTVKTEQAEQAVLAYLA